jgi:hypothetical protein
VERGLALLARAVAAVLPRHVGCARAIEILHVYVYVDAVAAGGGAERFAGVAAHLAACGPCGDDFHGLLATMRPVN